MLTIIVRAHREWYKTAKKIFGSNQPHLVNEMLSRNVAMIALASPSSGLAAAGVVVIIDSKAEMSCRERMLSLSTLSLHSSERLVRL